MNATDKWCLVFSSAFLILVFGCYGYQALRPKQKMIGPEYGILVETNPGPRKDELEFTIQLGEDKYSQFVRLTPDNQVYVVHQICFGIYQVSGFKTERWDLDMGKRALRLYGDYKST